MDRRTFCGALAGIGLAGAWPRGSAAQEAFPARPIRLVVPFASGSDMDAMARALAEKIADNVRWTLVIDNVPGANGNLGLEDVAKSPPDGYTIGLGHTSNLTVNPALPAAMAVDPLLDLVAISQVSSQAQLLVVAGSSKFAALKDLVDAARAKPDALRMGSPGKGTMGHLAGELLQQRAGVRWRHVPAKDTPSALKDLLGKRTDFCFTNLRAATALIDKGLVRAVAVTSPRRLASKPDVAAIAEAYAGFDATTWTGIVAPAKLSKVRVFEINIEVQHALERKDMQEWLAADGIIGVGGPPQNFGEYVRAEHFKWGALIKSSGLKL